MWWVISRNNLLVKRERSAAPFFFFSKMTFPSHYGLLTLVNITVVIGIMVGERNYAAPLTHLSFLGSRPHIQPLWLVQRKSYRPTLVDAAATCFTLSSAPSIRSLRTANWQRRGMSSTRRRSPLVSGRWATEQSLDAIFRFFNRYFALILLCFRCFASYCR